MTGQEYDVVVVGSGAAGMVAALTAAHQGLSTVVVEKAPHYGGSTARSGGGVWIPNNEILKRDGVKDTPDAARTYLHKIIGDVVPAEKIDTYLDRSPEMLSFVCKHSPLKLCWVPGYSDYYPETPGGKPTGRSVEPKPFNAKKLGADEKGLEPPYGKVPMNMVVMQQDYVRLNQLKRHPRGVLRSIKVGVRSVWANATGKNLVGMGRALIADSTAAMAGSLLGTSTTTSYIESAAGVSAGGRTGLTAIVVAILFLLALFFAPLAGSVPAFATAPALLFVAVLMASGLAEIDWEDITVAAPVVVTALAMPFTYSIATGIAFGFISWTAIKLLSGRRQDLKPALVILSILFVIKLGWFNA